jgi:hypothetical protein
VGDVDLIFEEIAQSAGQRIETLLAVPTLDRPVVGSVPELDVGIE